ncbi:hypothetical protein [Halorubrum salinum]|uniref:hypothetical protein n=1 Tax=Halorubrum salinum TaxID=767517 RepID=UPI002110EF6B|nr:hypothetical protein [Halorubrum salinum]
MSDVMDRLAETPRRSTTLSPRQFETSTNSQGSMSEIAAFTANTAHGLKTGRSNPIRLVIPAYQSFETAGDGSDQSFNLTYDLIESPDTQDVVVWFGGDYQGSPKSVDHDADSITVSGPGSVATVHVYYVAGNAASFELRKKLPGSKVEGNEQVYDANLGLIHNANQAEQPEFLELNESKLQRYLATDMELEARIRAPYQVRWTDPDGDGTEPTNALLQVPAQKANTEVPGLRSAVSTDMGNR